MNLNNLPPLWKFDFGDYTQLGSTFQKFLGNLNQFTLPIYNLINGQIGFANMARVLYTFNVIAGTSTPFSFVNPLVNAPSGLNLVRVVETKSMATPIAGTVFVGNWFYDGENINILGIQGLTSGKQYTIAVEVM